MIFIIMERDKEIIELYGSGVTVTQISEEVKLGRRAIYRVLENNKIPLRKTIEKQCLLCSKYSSKNLCGTCNTNLRRYRVKKVAVEYLGGKCNKCGWFGDLSGFDFHHRDPNQKDFNPSALELANKSWELVKKELDKCELLCALCHRLEHSSYNKFADLVLTYKGKTFIKA